MATKTRTKVVSVTQLEELFTIDTKNFTLCTKCAHRQNYLPGDSLCSYYRSPVDGGAYRKCKDLRKHNPVCEIFSPIKE